LTVLVALGSGVMAADGISNDEERDQRDRLLFFSSPLFSFFRFCYVSLSFMLLFVRLSSLCFYFLFLSVISSPSLSFFSVLSFIISSTQIFPSLLISPFFSPCSSLFFKTINPLCFFCLFPPLFLLFQNLPPLSPSLH
jgi:hypothetical protein